MAVPVKKKVKVLHAEYVEEAQSLLIVGECSEGRFRTQIHRDVFASYGDRTEEQIKAELEDTTKLMLGKQIYVVFDPDVTERVKANDPLKY